jgi:putative transcriptional regulator
MAKKTKEQTMPRGKARMRAEIVEAMSGLHKVGAVSEAELAETTLRMLGKDALLKKSPSSDRSRQG